MVTPIKRPLKLYDKPNKAINIPGDQRSEHPNQPQMETLREAMDLINYPIKTRLSSFGMNLETREEQYQEITVSKAKPKDWVSWKESFS